MFNWFKNKIELKNENCIMESVSNKKGIKIGSELIVPDNFECLIYHNCKYYFSLSSGKHRLDKQLMINLIDDQQKRSKNLKYVKFISHYINTSKQKLTIKFKKEKFAIEFVIDSPPKFANLMLLYDYKVDNNYTYTYLSEIFHELLLYNKGEYKQIASSTLSSYGITINSFAPVNSKSSIFDVSSKETRVSILKTDNLTNTQHDVKEENNQNSTSATPSNTKQEDVTIPQITETQSKNPSNSNGSSSFPNCPKCGNIVRFATTYCLKCGYKLSE